MDRLDESDNNTKVRLDPQINSEKDKLYDLILHCFANSKSKVEVSMTENKINFSIPINEKYLAHLETKVEDLEYGLRPEVKSKKLADVLFEDFKTTLDQIRLSDSNFENFVKYEPTLQNCLSIIENKISLSAAVNVKNKFTYFRNNTLRVLQKSILPLFKLSKDQLIVLGRCFLKENTEVRVMIENKYEQGYIEKISSDDFISVCLYNDNYSYEFPTEEIVIDNSDIIVSELKRRNVQINKESIEEYINWLTNKN